MRRSAIIILSFAFFSCLWLIRPSGPFEDYPPGAQPDYSNLLLWAAHPLKKDTADQLPADSGLTDGQDTASVDVFFVHPTTFYGRSGWNADLSDESVNERTDEGTIKMQAGVFNCCAKIYAPRYRQATLASFVDEEGNGVKALDLAYRDVLAAFDYYMTHYNSGRPIVVASHSQGTRHAMRLLKDRFDGRALQKRLVAGYLIGGAVSLDFYGSLKPCNSPADVSCVISWRTVQTGGEIRKLPTDPPAGSPILCVNPLSWKMDEVECDALKNLGGTGRDFEGIDAHVTGGRCRDGILWIDEVETGGYPSLNKNYHIMDYNLFYMNIRKNIEERIRAFK